MEDKISVIIPVYNAEQYIERCLQSVLGQTYNNYEIVVIDDGSTDQSAKICDAYSKKYRNITVRHQHNSGCSAARNAGMEIATGNYLTFVDADDYISSNYVENVAKHIRKSPQTDLFCAKRVMVELQNNGILHQKESNYNLKEKLYDHAQMVELIKKYVFWKGLGCVCGVFYKRSFLEENQIQFPDGMARMEDVIFNLYSFYKANTMYYVSDSVYYYLLHAGSACNHFDRFFSEKIDRFYEEYNRFDMAVSAGGIFEGACYEAGMYLFHEWLLLNVLQDAEADVFVKFRAVKSFFDSDLYIQRPDDYTGGELGRRWKIFERIYNRKMTLASLAFVELVYLKRRKRR